MTSKALFCSAIYFAEACGKSVTVGMKWRVEPTSGTRIALVPPLSVAFLGPLISSAQTSAKPDWTTPRNSAPTSWPPFICFPHHTITGQKQHKFIRSVETVEEEPHTAVGDIDYEAVARRNSNSDLDLRYTVDAVARRPASLLCRPYLAGPQLSLVVGGGAWNFQATKRTI